MRRWVTIVAIASVVLAACSDSEPEAEPSPSPLETVATTLTSTLGPTVSEEIFCPNEAVVSDPDRRLQAPVRTDVDGDGSPEDVYVAFDSTGTIGCQAFLVVRAEETFHSQPIWEAGVQGGLPRPSIHGFVEINGAPGVEILVDEAGGASTQFVGAFVFGDRGLSRIAVKGGVPSSVSGVGDLFPYGGSVGHLEAVDCAPDGTIVVSSAVPGSSQEDLEEGIYNVQRTFYLLDGAVLRKEGATREQVPVERLNEFPEYAAGPFGSC